MDQTSNLKLPYIIAAQSQKHVTHNEALKALDAVVQLAVADKDLSAPPGSPAEGVRYIVGASPTGSWAGHAKSIAAYQDAAWVFYVPVEGWHAWVSDEDAFYMFDGTTWGLFAGGGSVNPVSLVGVNATADTTNRLSVSSPASLFNHEGNGHQIKINKNVAGDTGSMVFQTGFSGRAEFGLAGDDDFHVKVSPDGSAWYEGLVISRSSGAVRAKLGLATVASAATCDIGAALAQRVKITGTTTITSLGTVANELRFVVFDDALTLTQNATTLILPGAANIVTVSGDAATFASDSTGKWKCLDYQRANGRGVNLGTAAILDVGTSANNVVQLDGSGKLPTSLARKVLTANRTYYVRTDGNDANDGSADTSGAAFLTVQKAISTVQTLDLSIYNVTIQVADGTYNETVSAAGAFVGSGSVTINGNTTTPANVIIGSSSSNGFDVSGGARVLLSNFRPRAGAAGNALNAKGSGYIGFWGLSFPAVTNSHITTNSYGIVECLGAYTIAGGASSHAITLGPSEVLISNTTVTLSGTPAFGSAFLSANFLGAIIIYNNTYSGSATGKRYDVNTNSIVQSNGATLPGNVAGTTATGGQYQ